VCIDFISFFQIHFDGMESQDSLDSIDLFSSPVREERCVPFVVENVFLEF
jgi:hypothetical protein